MICNAGRWDGGQARRSLRSRSAAALLAATLSSCNSPSEGPPEALASDVAAAIFTCKSSQWVVAAAFEGRRDIPSLMPLSSANRSCREAARRLQATERPTPKAKRAAKAATEMSAGIAELGAALEVSGDVPEVSASAASNGLRRYLLGFAALNREFAF